MEFTITPQTLFVVETHPWLKERILPFSSSSRELKVMAWRSQQNCLGEVRGWRLRVKSQIGSQSPGNILYWACLGQDFEVGKEVKGMDEGMKERKKAIKGRKKGWSDKGMEKEMKGRRKGWGNGSKDEGRKGVMKVKCQVRWVYLDTDWLEEWKRRGPAPKAKLTFHISGRTQEMKQSLKDV